MRHWRSYSLSAPPRRDGRLTVTVKAVDGGRVSVALARSTPVGAVLALGPASGDFVLPATVLRPLLFVTAGSGVTPVTRAAAGARADRGIPDAVLLHSAPDGDSVIFGDELRALAAAHPSFRLHEQHTRTAGRLALSALDDAGPGLDRARRPTSADRPPCWTGPPSTGPPPASPTGCASSGSGPGCCRRPRHRRRHGHLRPHRPDRAHRRTGCWTPVRPPAPCCRAAAGWASATAASCRCCRAGSATCAPARCTANRATSSRPASAPPAAAVLLDA